MRSIGQLLCRSLVAVALVLGGVIFVPATGAGAAPVTHTDNITLQGTSAEQHLLHAEVFCDECFPDDFFDCGGCEVAGGGKIDVLTSVAWSAAATVDTTADPDELVQGTSPYVTSTVTPGAGTITIKYRAPYQVGLFGRNGDFPPGPEWHRTTEYTLVDEFNVSTSAPCTPRLTGDGTGTCNVTDTINLLPETCFFAGCPLDVTINLVIDHVFTVGEAGIIAHRTSTFSAPATLPFSGPSPASLTRPISVPCDAPVGADVNYSLSGFTYRPNVSVAGSAKIVVELDGPGPFNASPEIDLLSGNVFSPAPVAMSSSETADAFLGDVLLDNIAPKISAVMQSGSFVEGSDVAFSGLVTDNCAAGLNYLWRFSDDGVAYGNEAHHAFADDGSGYTGRLVAADAAGNRTAHDFDVQAISNANPIATAPPGASSDWGRPVSFHADAVDPGPADQPTLQFQWSFGDGAGASGADVTHTYTSPGVYPVTVTVRDKDGGTGVANMSTTITKRDATLVYTGDIQGLPNKVTQLSATLSDEYGQPVVGRPVVFVLGSQTATAYTDSAGRAATTMRLNQKTGTYPLSASYAGDSRYFSSATPTQSYRVGK